MAEAGIGVDIVEISRMKSILEKTPSFARRVFTEEERAYCDASSRPAAHYASRFASREAVLKALGTGFSQGVGRKDVSVTRDKLGKPKALLSGRALTSMRLLSRVWSNGSMTRASSVIMTPFSPAA